MSGFRVIMTFVPHGRAEQISNAANSAGSAGGTVLMGRGITKSSFMAALGIGDTTRDVVVILAAVDSYKKIYDAVVDSCKSQNHMFGEILTLDSDCMLKTGTILKSSEGESTMSERSLITVILNKGYADDAMAAARKAGAGGGTVINARGTAREDDAKFFGIHIVPEKEMLFIVVDSDRKDAVLESVRTLPCLSEPGSGIAFCSDVCDFSLLGKK